MTAPDPFQFVHDALGVRVGHVEDGAQGAGYYLLAPDPEWLGKSYTAALRNAKSMVREVEPRAPFDWMGAARAGVSLLDMLLPDKKDGASAPVAGPGDLDDDDLPD